MLQTAGEPSTRTNGGKLAAGGEPSITALVEDETSCTAGGETSDAELDRTLVEVVGTCLAGGEPSAASEVDDPRETGGEPSATEVDGDHAELDDDEPDDTNGGAVDP